MMSVEAKLVLIVLGWWIFLIMFPLTSIIILVFGLAYLLFGAWLIYPIYRYVSKVSAFSKDANWGFALTSALTWPLLVWSLYRDGTWREFNECIEEAHQKLRDNLTKFNKEAKEEIEE